MLQPSITSPESKSDGTPDAFDIRPSAVQNWVANLPLADVSKTCGLVFNALAETNTRSLPPQQRFNLLEVMREPVHYLIDALSRHLAGTGLPLAPQMAKIGALLHGLQREIAKGYQRITQELLDLDRMHQDFTLLAQAMQRALCYYGQALLTGYQAYRPVMPGLWGTIHGLYEGAERKGVARSVIKDFYSGPDRVVSVESQYKQILLLALADPLRLGQGDMERLARLLGPWAGSCRLYSAGGPPIPDDACIVDLASDRPPVRRPYAGDMTPSPNVRWLDTTALVEDLRRGATRPPPELFQIPLARSAAAERLWLTLVRRLLTAWGTESKRGFTRKEGGLAAMQWVSGLSGSHSLLSDEENGQLEVPFAFGQRAPRALPRRSSAREDVVNSAMIINESANGACLRWVDALPGRVRVDEVLALRQPHQQHWGIGVVRWLKTLNNRGLELGVELLGPEVIPVMVRHHEGGNEPDDLKSLYLPEVGALRQPASLLVPTLFFQPGDVVTLQMARQAHRLRLEVAVESNRVYTRFQVGRAN